jgi:hypothetical protein
MPARSGAFDPLYHPSRQRLLGATQVMGHLHEYPDFRLLEILIENFTRRKRSHAILFILSCIEIVQATAFLSHHE